MAIFPHYDKLLSAVRESDLPDPSTGSGKYVKSTGSGYTLDTPAGGSSLAVQDFKVEYASVTTTYQGIVSAGTAVGTTGWDLIKTILTGNDYESRSVYTASDSWNNRASASYTLSNTYSN